METLKNYKAIHYIPELWTDAVYMNMIERPKIVELFLEILTISEPLENSVLPTEVIVKTAQSISSRVDTVIEFAKTSERGSSLQLSLID